jgi:hypothetical protein
MFVNISRQKSASNRMIPIIGFGAIGGRRYHAARQLERSSTSTWDRPLESQGFGGNDTRTAKGMQDVTAARMRVAGSTCRSTGEKYQTQSGVR